MLAAACLMTIEAGAQVTPRRDSTARLSDFPIGIVIPPALLGLPVVEPSSPLYYRGVRGEGRTARGGEKGEGQGARGAGRDSAAPVGVPLPGRGAPPDSIIARRADSTVTVRMPPDSIRRIDTLAAAGGPPPELRMPRPIAADTTIPPRRDSIPRLLSRDTVPAARDSSPLAPRPSPLGGPPQLRARIEAKAERTRNERCSSSQLYAPVSSCRGGLQPSMQMQFALRSANTFADRFHVDVDYDTEREFDASNTVSAFYAGDPGDRIERVELGNVAFTLPASRFVTAGVPSGNYGAQVVARAGPLRLRAIAAQQKGNVVRSREFTVGAQVLQGNEREIPDYQVEARRFFFTIDPTLLGGYPNVDLLDRAQLERLRASLPDTLRPTRVQVYRLQFGAPPQNPNAPRFRLLDQPGSGRQTYDVLREGIDYYMDPSLLWFALARPLNAASERLVVAYAVRIDGRDTTWLTTGGTPDVQATGGDQAASLVWDPGLGPDDPAFRREIRSAYRIAGPELQRRTTRLRIVTGSADQERPLVSVAPEGRFDTYLQMLGLSQANNGAEFDAETRLWPRTGDAVFGIGATATAGTGVPSGADATASSLAVIPDYFVIFPSLQPFARRDSGLVLAGNPTNASIYTTPGELLVSPQHPPTVYRLRVAYEAQGNGAVGALELGVVQIRPASERVELDGRRLQRDLDYRMDYDVGRITFLRPDTLFSAPRRVVVSYEENPLFAPAPTTLFGFVTELPLARGALAFSAVSQSQRTTFTRPQLGFEPVSSLVAGVTGRYAWDAPWVQRFVDALPFGRGTARGKSRLAVQGELAASRPRIDAGEAYLESFEGTAGIDVPLQDPQWQYASLPAYGTALAPRFGAGFFEPRNAATLAWQNNAVGADGKPVLFTFRDIDSLTTFAGAGADFNVPEPLLWLTLYPLGIGGRLDQATRGYGWTIGGNTPGARRFRSIRTTLSPTGLDLTRVEQIEFWTLIDTAAAVRGRNPTLVLDFGDVSENALSIAPESLFVRRAGATVDSVFTGKRVAGLDSLNSERDPFSRAFDVGRNDVGLPGDVADTLVVVDSTSGDRTPRLATDVPLCLGAPRALQLLGDTRTNCTRGNWRLDEEDIDLDGALNLDLAHREDERLLRYVVDLSDPAVIARVGRDAVVTDTAGGVAIQRHLQWVLVRVPWRAPADSIGTVSLRRMRALRLTIVSGPAAGDGDFTQLPLARLRLVGAPWVKRTARPIAGIAGEREGGQGFVVATVIGTADRDSLRGVDYEPPPGVREQANSRGDLQGGGGRVQINEHSMRILAGGLAPFERAEAYYRFPSGEQNVMAYRELRLWARGRGNGWGTNGELQAFVRIGRDADNFYLYRTPTNAGAGRGAWLPELRIDLRRFFALRERVQNAYLRSGTDTLSGCTALDSALVANSEQAAGAGRRYVACDGPYMVYSADPGVAPPNLAAVQELAVGIVRVAEGGGISPILPADTLELWVDDIRLGRAANDAGYAGQVGLELVAGDVAELRVNGMRRDGNFRQLGERPSFLDDRALEIATTLRLDKLLPRSLGFALPLTVTRTSTSSEPLFLSQSDVPGRGIAGLRTPRRTITTYALTLRRTAPLANPLLGALANNLALTSSYTAGGDRSEYNDGGSRRFALSLDWLAADSARTAAMPDWLGRAFSLVPAALGLKQAPGVRGQAAGRIRWNPTELRFTSGIVDASDRRWSYLKPASVTDDAPRLSVALTQLWRSASSLELRPVDALTARWDFVSVRDLRDYGDTNAVARLASQARGSVLGVPSFERERRIQSSVTLAPRWSGWLRPRLEWGSQYQMLRDPNSRYSGLDSTTLANLPRRATASQTLAASATLDFGAAMLATGAGDSARAKRFGRAVAPLDLTFTRQLSSSLDAATWGPSTYYQLGFAGPDGFRLVDGNAASSAGATTTLGASHALVLPHGFSLVHRFRRTATQNWARRLAGEQARVDGAQTVFPDLSLRWSWRPVALRDVLAAVGATAGLAEANAFSTIPAGIGGTTELRRSRVRSVPLTASLAFADGVGPSLTTGLTLAQRTDSLPGAISHGTTRDLNLDLAQRVRIPRSIAGPFRNDVRLHFGMQRGSAEATVADVGGTRSSRTVDQGRSAWNLGADTDLSDALLFTFQGSRIVTFDRNLNRRVSQLVFSTVLQIDFARLAK